MRRPIVIAEIGGNHGGSLEWAKKAIEVATECGVDYVKFQKRDVEAIPDSIKDRIRSDQHAFGRTEYEHRKALEFSEEQHAELALHCKLFGVRYACSAWDQKSVDFLCGLELDYIKIPSACNQKFLSWHFGVRLPVHISLGMLSGSERDSLLRLMLRDGRQFIPYACTSKYPCEMQETYLGEIPYLLTRFQEVGFSGHHQGIAVDLAAECLGARYIERHFTLDRSLKGTDQSASLAPDGLRKLVRDLDAIALAWQPKPGHLPTCEIEPRKKLKGV